MPGLDGGEFGFVPLPDVDVERLAAFDCGTPHLNAFLQGDAGPMQRDHLGFTMVVFQRGVEGVAAYFTLANDALQLNTSEVTELGLEVDVSLRSFPAVKLGRLAVAKELQSAGVGRALMGYMIGTIYASTTLSAARLLVVDADAQPRVVAFYERCGFVQSLSASKAAANHKGPKGKAQTVKMMRDLLLPWQ